jgi:hypothetical protein
MVESAGRTVMHIAASEVMRAFDDVVDAIVSETIGLAEGFSTVPRRTGAFPPWIGGHRERTEAEEPLREGEALQ